MSIKSFIQEEILMPRLQKAQVLAVYDPDCRYGELCLGMADDKRLVVDASPSSITPAGLLPLKVCQPWAAMK
jgi:hypothetical protein